MVRFWQKKKQRPDLAEKVNEAETLQKANEICRRRSAELRERLDETMASWDKRRNPVNP